MAPFTSKVVSISQFQNESESELGPQPTATIFETHRHLQALSCSNQMFFVAHVAPVRTGLWMCRCLWLASQSQRLERSCTHPAPKEQWQIGVPDNLCVVEAQRWRGLLKPLALSILVACHCRDQCSKRHKKSKVCASLPVKMSRFLQARYRNGKFPHDTTSIHTSEAVSQATLDLQALHFAAQLFWAETR